MLRALLRRAALAAALACPSAALADVVMSPPRNCPPGQVGITSHSGPRCVKVAPKNCPPGWSGVLGGNCELSPCNSDGDCTKDQQCIEHSVCLSPFKDDYFDYDEEDREMVPGIGDRSFFGAPPRPRKKRPAPVTRFNAVNVCGPKVACNEPDACQPQKLCVAIGRLAAPYAGTNIEPVRVSRKILPAMPTAAPTASAAPSAPPPPSAPPAPSGEPTAAPTASSPPPPPEVHGGGCGGCSAPGGEGSPAAMAALAALGALASWRGRRRA